jgi:hypothetical protein
MEEAHMTAQTDARRRGRLPDTEPQDDTYKAACEYAETSLDPMAIMLREAWARLQAGDVSGAELSIHGAMLANGHLALNPPADAERDRLRADALRYRYLRERHSYHYGVDMACPRPAEWGVEWSYQQTLPGEQFLSLDDLIDQDIAALDEEDRLALSVPVGGEKGC